MRNNLKLSGLIALCALMSACGESSPETAVDYRAAAGLDRTKAVEVCESLIAAPGSTVSMDSPLSCQDCTVTHLAAAVDGNYDSDVEVRFAGTTEPMGGFRLRASAPPGVTFPAGYAGAFMAHDVGSAGQFSGQVSITVRSYLHGVLQETSLPSSSGGLGTVVHEYGLYGFDAAKPYDSIEVDYQWRGVVEPAAVRISEFCRKATNTIQAPERSPVDNVRPVVPAADGRVEVDLVLLYTPRFEAGFGSAAAAEDRARNLVIRANQVFENSRIPVRYRIAAVQRYTGVSETLTSHQAFVVLQNDPAVKRYRDGVGADVAVLLMAKDLGVSLCGMGSLFNGGRQSDQADSIDRDLDGYAMIAAGPGRYGPACADNVLAHELGHVLGAGHQFSPSSNAAYWKAYSHAFACGTGSDGQKQVTIMDEGAGMVEATVFSSPALSREGDSCGQTGVQGAEATQADNARAVTEAAPYVAAYREPR